MDLYFSPMACSLATRIALYEAGAQARYLQVDTRSKQLVGEGSEGSDYRAVAPLGQVPALRTDDGMLLTENAAVLQYVAERFPQAALLPPEGSERARLRQWLGFIGTELHKALFVPLLDPQAGAEVRAYAKDHAALRLGLLQDHFSSHEYLLAQYSVADAYLVAVLNWAPFADVDLAAWPAVQQYHRRLVKRPQVARAMAEEFELYKQQQARRHAAVPA